MKVRSLIIFLFFSASIFAQTTFTTSPQYPTETDQITITFDVTHQTDSRTLVGYTQDVYAYTCVTTVINNGTPTPWQHEKVKWALNTPDLKLTRSNTNQNVYSLTVNNPRNFYGITNVNEKITELDFVLRSSDGLKQTENIFVPLYSAGISIIMNSPTVNLSYGDPMRSPVCIPSGSSKLISVTTTVTGSITLFINGNQIAQSSTNSLSYNFIANDYPIGRNDIKIVASDNGIQKDSTLFVIMRNPEIKNLPIPSGSQIGINYNTGVLALYAPGKKFIYLIGDQTDWKVDQAWFMNRDNSTPDSLWWIQIPVTTADPPGEMGYQFLIDGDLRIYDPYTDKILDPANDTDPKLQQVYPNLKAYPTQKTSGIVSVLQPAKPTYNWKVPNFIRPAKENLVIYELLVRDFVATHSYKTLLDTLSYFKRLGINAIELMPISEFEGNNSWGYNPMTYFAPDKYYGTMDDLKNFIDACHQNGIAVIQDIVLNHAYNSNSMAQMYWDNVNSRPAANNPWFNVTSPNPVYSWGNDFNHESAATKYFVDRVTSYWLTEFKVDGFRFDFTKGFTNTPGDGTAYDAKRIAILKRMADKIWQVSPTAYVILEHFCANSEETELANYGMMLWGNLNNAYSQATTGNLSGSYFGDISYKSRSWNSPNLVGYMESHDEERLMYNNLTSGRSSGSYDIKTLTTALDRIKLAATFFIPVPGPKMIWMGGELGYDVSINTNGRTGEKPFEWNYLSDANRKSLFNTFAALIHLKKAYPAFSSSDFTINAWSATKSLYINHSSMNVAAIGNFDVTTQSAPVTFQSVGMWYEFFSGDSLSVTDVDMQIDLQPGEYRLYTSKKIPKASILADVKKEETLPTEFRLEQNYPNPFNPETVISYWLPVAGHVSLKVFDLLGREVATLVDEFQNAGTYNSQFSIIHSQLTSGVYFYRLQAGNFVQTKKMIVLK